MITIIISLLFIVLVFAFTFGIDNFNNTKNDSNFIKIIVSESRKIIENNIKTNNTSINNNTKCNKIV